MSIWHDLFDIYQSVQSGETPAKPVRSGEEESRTESEGQRADDIQQTVYVFAYIDDGKGNISRNIAVEDRITMLEMKNQELEYRYNRLLEQLEEDQIDEDD